MNSLLLSCNDDDYPYAEIPSVVLNKLWAEYPDATDAEFHQTSENYEVEFEIGNKDHKVLISPKGLILCEKKEIAWKDLPPEVRETLEMLYGQENIQDVELVRLDGEVYYQAEVGRFFVEEVVLNHVGKKDPALNYWK